MFTALDVLRLVQFSQELTDCRYAFWIKMIDPAGVDGNTDASCLRVHTEGRFQQVIAVF